jgi:segregation and condensation protein B
MSETPEGGPGPEEEGEFPDEPATDVSHKPPIVLPEEEFADLPTRGDDDEWPDEDPTTTREGPPPEHEDEGGGSDEEPTVAQGEGSPRLQSIVESLLFAADKPLGLRQLAELTGESDLTRVRAAVAAVEAAHQEAGVQLHSVAGGYQFRTHPGNAGWVQKLLAQKPVRLSRALLETLAICAYRQPITRPEIDEIRGVDSGGTLKTLMERSLVRILGKKEEPGRPLLYGTTKEFLEFFNLGDLKDLPSLREFHELSEEHQAQVAALESVAPSGSVDAAPAPLPRAPVLSAPVEDPGELEEIDRLIRTAGGDKLPEGLNGEAQSE